MGLTERQKRAALDHTRSKCVTAGAGTGKTHVLVQKYIDLLESRSDIGIRNILALTFTEKAAKQMKERVREAVAKKDGARWAEIRDDLLWANISTFHSFCAQVLREFPLEAGVDPGFSVLDERESRRLREKVMEGLIYGESQPACRDALIATLRAIGPHELRNYLERLYDRRGPALECLDAIRGGGDAVLAAWRRIVAERKEEAAEEFFRDGRLPEIVSGLQRLAARYTGEADPAMAYLRAVEPHLSCLSPEAPGADRCRALAALAGINRQFRANMGRKQNWDPQDLDELRRLYGDLNSRIRQHAEILTLDLDPDDPFTRATLSFLCDLGTVFSAFLEAMDAEKRQRGALDFSDLIYSVHRLFCDHDELVEAHFRERFRFILVDEFQDTDPVQIGIITRILGDLSQESERLFIVGDPKQSIYLFRDADVTQFRKTRDLIAGRLGGEEVHLDINFRSTPEIVGFVNSIFGVLMAESSRPWEFAYEPLTGSRKDDSGSIELLLCPKTGDRTADIRTEAEMVARKIRQIVGQEKKPIYWDREGRPLNEPRAAEYGDIAILLERRTNLIHYEWALRRYGVPYHVHAGLGFYERQEIRDLYNILRFLENELDDVALYGVLRSPYFGLTDADIYHAAASGAPWDPLRERLQRYAGEHPGSDAAAAAALLDAWLAVTRRIPPADLLGRIVSESGVCAVYGGMPEGRQILANIEKFIGMARTAQSGGFATLSGFVEEIGLCIDEEQREGEAQPDLTAADAVSIMTVHAAKGLEFPVVVLPDLSSAGSSGSSGILVEEGLRLGVKIPNPANDHEREETAIMAILRDEYRRKEAAERKRLFYVGLTRAKDHLILCGIRPDAPPDDLAACRTRIDWLAHCLGLCEEAYAAGAVRIEQPGEGRPISVLILTDPRAVPAELREEGIACISVPADIRAAEPPVRLAPVTVPEEARTYSVSEIERYRRCPLEYERIYLLGEAERPIRSAGEDARTRGLILHEVFRGRDPAAVLQAYGVTDASRAEKYARLYRRFLASD
ncbi:MAG: UvrD-helicase domain-containing protein, partial [Methanomicrobiaceae archaeon]|nr:UvrD-helicase domain-containing protein [Methanomicrobiaceae archaeon]